MSILGSGAVAIWHDIVPEGRTQFYAWHGREHMPERAAIPGFRRGRRYIAVDADLEFFNLYETRDADVVRSDDYKARLDNPTPWTLSTVQHFRDVARSLCAVAFSSSGGDGGLMATLRYSVEGTDEAAHLAAMTGDVLPALAEAEGIAGVHLLVADMEASGYVNAEQKARGARNDVPRFVLLVEGWGDEAAFAETMKSGNMETRLAGAGVAASGKLGIYRHQVTIAEEAG